MKAKQTSKLKRKLKRGVKAQSPITGAFKFNDVDDIAKLCEPLPWHEYYQAGFIAGINACRKLLIRNTP